MDENICQIGAEVSRQAKTKAKANARAKLKVSGFWFLADREPTKESIGNSGALSAVQS